MLPADLPPCYPFLPADFSSLPSYLTSFTITTINVITTSITTTTTTTTTTTATAAVTASPHLFHGEKAASTPRKPLVVLPVIGGQKILRLLSY